MSFLPASTHGAELRMQLSSDALSQLGDYAHPPRVPWLPGAAAAAAAPSRPARPAAATYHTLCHALCERMDPMTRMHDMRRRDDLAEVVRTRILTFLSREEHAAPLAQLLDGKAKNIARFFSAPRDMREDATDHAALGRFLTFWLDQPCFVAGAETEEAPTGLAFAPAPPSPPSHGRRPFFNKPLALCRWQVGEAGAAGEKALGRD